MSVGIKPLDGARDYSARSLVEDTLRRQLVGQYLNSRNSGSGILVVMQLDDKTWTIEGKKRCSFAELVVYLQMQANRIQLESPGLNALRVVGMSYLPPKPGDSGAG